MDDFFKDKEFIIMSEIDNNDVLSQRDLSKKMGISVSTVNSLMRKMIKEGLVKMTQVSKRQVLYMLTPEGILEKSKKTFEYLKVHYKAIYEMKIKIKSVLELKLLEHDVIFIFVSKDEIGELVSDVVQEMSSYDLASKIVMIDQIARIDDYNYCNGMLLYLNDDCEMCIKNHKLNIDCSSLKDLI